MRKYQITLTRKVFLLGLTLFNLIIFSGCRKNIEEIYDQAPKEEIKSIKNINSYNRNHNKSNPLSLKKIKKIKNRNNQGSRIEDQDIPIEQQLIYLKIDPSNLGTEIMKLLEVDSTITLMEFPFADAGIYGDEFSLDEQNVESLKDGLIYAVVPASFNLFQQHDVPITRLDTLYKPLNEEDTLVLRSLIEDGYITDEDANSPERFERPEGFVRYTDAELGANQPVIKIQVTSLFFGVPFRSYTNEGGWFRIPWKYLFGTFITTKAVNDRVNIKPINTAGLLWPIVIIPQFIVGSVHVHGWVRSRDLDDIIINFTNHGQNRFWAHVLNSTHYHDQFTQQDNILSAPQKMVIWAHWGDNYGNASAPMLGHIPGSLGSLVVQWIEGMLGTGITNYQNLLNLLLGVLPDMTVRSGNTPRGFYSARLMQTCFHELGHASHYRSAGNNYWQDLIIATMFPNGDCGGYGCGTGNNDGTVAVAESWAEFIGTEYGLRRYPDGQKFSVSLDRFIRFDDALEDEGFFVNTWIPTGIFNDLQDNFNPTENGDNVSGASINQLFSVFDPTIRNMCDYFSRFTQLYWSQFGIQPVLDIFMFHDINCAF